MGPVPATAETRKFGKYTLVAKLAQGGMAEIFLARLGGAARFEKLVCIKRILPQFAEDPQFVTMFLDEARVAARISHPNVCQVFELGELEGQYYIAMEYLEGIPLAAFRRRELYPIAPDPQLVAGIITQACEGLHHAHNLKAPDGSLLGVVHRDVSPANLFVTTDGVVKVLDFGIAKMHDASHKTTTGSVKGTYAYMPPEQLRGEPLDQRADVFALGAVTWELLARKHLFRRDTDFLTFQAITKDPIPDISMFRPDVSPELAKAIAQALSRDRHDRFQTARAYGEAVYRAMAAFGGPLAPSAISDEVQRAFSARLEEQRVLLEVARGGGAFDLDEHPTTPAPFPAAETPRRSDVHHVPTPAPSVTMEVVTPGSAIRGRAPSPYSVITPSAPHPMPNPAMFPRASSSQLPYPTPLPHAPRGATWWIPVVALILVGGAAAMFYIWVNRTPPPAPASEPSVVMTVAAGDAAPGPDAMQVAAEAAHDASELDAGAAEPIAEPTVPTTPPLATIPEPPPRKEPRRRVETKPPESTPAGDPGMVTIDCAIGFAKVYIDGTFIDDTPIVDHELPAGKHTVRAVSSSGAVKTFPVVVESGKRTKKMLEW